MAKAVGVRVPPRAPNYFPTMMKRIVAVASLAALAACAQQKSPTESAGSAAPAFRALGQKATVEESRTDEAIGFAVRDRLNAVAPSETAGVIVEVNEGVVTLRGVVPTVPAVWRAEAAARAVKGVKQVANRLVVSGPGPSP